MFLATRGRRESSDQLEMEKLHFRCLGREGGGREKRGDSGCRNSFEFCWKHGNDPEEGGKSDDVCERELPEWFLGFRGGEWSAEGQSSVQVQVPSTHSSVQGVEGGMCIEKQRHYSANKGPYSQGYGLPSGHILLWELNHKEGRVSKNWCLQTVMLENTPESPLDSKEIKPVSLKGNQSWILIGRTDAEAEAQVFWSPDVNSWLIGKVPDTGKDWGQKEKRALEDETARWHHRCNGRELGQTLGDSEGQGGLACCSPWGLKEADWVTEQQRPLIHLSGDWGDGGCGDGSM